MLLNLLRAPAHSGARPWLTLLALATLSCALLLLDDFLQQQYTANNRAELELSYVAALWLWEAALLAMTV